MDKPSNAVELRQHLAERELKDHTDLNFFLADTEQCTQEDKRKRAEARAEQLKLRILTWDKMNRTDHPYLVQDLFYIDHMGFSEIARVLAPEVVDIIIRWVRCRTSDPEYINNDDDRMRSVAIDTLLWRLACILVTVDRHMPEQSQDIRKSLHREIDLVNQRADAIGLTEQLTKWYTNPEQSLLEKLKREKGSLQRY